MKQFYSQAASLEPWSLGLPKIDFLVRFSIRKTIASLALAMAAFLEMWSPVPLKVAFLVNKKPTGSLALAIGGAGRREYHGISDPMATVVHAMNTLSSYVSVHCRDIYVATIWRKVLVTLECQAPCG